MSSSVLFFSPSTQSRKYPCLHGSQILSPLQSVAKLSDSNQGLPWAGCCFGESSSLFHLAWIEESVLLQLVGQSCEVRPTTAIVIASQVLGTNSHGCRCVVVCGLLTTQETATIAMWNIQSDILSILLFKQQAE